MNQHHDQVEANIPELSGMVPARFKEIIQFNPLVASFRGSPLVVHAMPLITIPGRRGIETEVGVHRNGAGSAIPGRRAGSLTGTGSIVVQWATKFSVFSLEIIAIRFHLQSGFTDRNTIGPDSHAVVIRSFPGVTQVEIDEWDNMFTLAQGIHGHGVMSRVQEKRSRL